MNQTPNGSSTPLSALNTPREATLHAAYLAVSALTMFTCVCGMAGNGLVVWLLGFRLQRTPFCTYVLNLAGADLLFLLCMASMLSLETRPLAGARALAHEAIERVKFFAYTAGLSLLMAISAQRCLSVLFPLWVKGHQHRSLPALVCALLWALALLLNTFTTLFCGRLWRADPRRCFMVDMTLSALIMGVFTPVMTVSSVTLFVQVRRSARQWQRRSTHLYVIVLASVLVFLVCSLPLGLYWFVLFWVGLPPDVLLVYACVSRLSSSVSSSANPAIYFLVGARRSLRLRGSLKVVLLQALQEEPELGGGETPPTDSDKAGA
ncbi:mas-related G-protein coupled receptor member D [Carlito syrichta]|uniref:Mas-related G-protein coupled receptor member D n=1 Tax=Carlito syrichta TaxID=1868482 RepID=A0A1U7U5H5_CARSF|nr:mas-related G-protein coupled receptor member D [Carlito syrichta]